MSELRDLLELIETEQVMYRNALDGVQSEQEKITLIQNRDAAMAAYRAQLQSFVGEKTSTFMQQLVESGNTLYVVQKHYKLIREQEKEMEMRRR